MRSTLLTCKASLFWLSLAPFLVSDIFVDGSAGSCEFASGGPGDPVCTIADGIALAATGDTVHIAPGTYFERILVPHDLTLVGTGGEAVTTVDAGGTASVLTIPAGVDVTVEGLTLTGGSAPLGAGALVRGALTLRNSTISGNTAARYGGGIAACCVEGASLNIIDSEVCDNVCTVPFAKGGGIHVIEGSLMLTGSTIAGNLLNLDTLTVGGGIYARYSDVEIVNSTISGNRSRDVGGFRGIAVYGIMNHTTVAENEMNSSSMFSSVETDLFYGAGGFGIVNSVFAANFGPPRPDLGGVPFNCLIQVGPGGNTNGINNSITGGNFVPLPDQLGPLTDNGGPTRTHALLPTSLARDHASQFGQVGVDQRGVLRPQAGLGDMGAYEFEVSPPESHCNGDGGITSGCTDCPCFNAAPSGTIGGCLNSSGTAARLTVSGSTSVNLRADLDGDLRFEVTGGPPSALCLLVSGEGLGPVNPASPCFGLGSGVSSQNYDGLRCAVGAVLRHGGRMIEPSGTSSSPWGGEGEPAEGVAKIPEVMTSGTTRYFQAVFRDDMNLVCQRGLNTTQALEILWTP